MPLSEIVLIIAGLLAVAIVSEKRVRDEFQHEVTGRQSLEIGL